MKVIKVSPSETIGQLPHQDIVIADATGTIRVSLWGPTINKMIEGESYRFKDFTVRLFRFKKYLNQSKNQSHIERIDDVGAVAQEVNEEDDDSMIRDVKIIGVPSLDIYKACLLCKAWIEPMTPPLGKCSKADCEMIQRYDMCPEQASAKLLLQYKPGDDDQMKLIQLNAYNNLLFELANLKQGANISWVDLLTTPTFVSMTYITDKRMVKSFSK